MIRTWMFFFLLFLACSEARTDAQSEGTAEEQAANSLPPNTSSEGAEAVSPSVDLVEVEQATHNDAGLAD